MKYINFALVMFCLILSIGLALRPPEVRTEIITETVFKTITETKIILPEKPPLPALPYGYHAQWLGDLIIISAPFGHTTLQGDQTAVMSIINSLNIRVCFVFIDTEATDLLVGTPLAAGIAFGCTPLPTGSSS